MTLRPCRSPLCPALVAGGWCPEHTPAVTRGRHLDSRYASKRWRVRRRVFLLDHPACASDCGHLATEVDHVTPVEDGGEFWDESNWQALCHRCHSRKTNGDVRTRRYT